MHRIRDWLIIGLSLTAAVSVCNAQTTVNGGVTTLGPINNANATSTIPEQVGTGAAPGTCASGQLYFRSGQASPGASLFVCDPANTETAVGTGTGVVIPSVTNLLAGNGSGGVSDSGIAPSTVVKGAANLATGGNPGPVPYTSAAGTLSQDASNALCIDATNHRVGIGTCTPAAILDIEDGSNGGMRFSDGGSVPVITFTFNGSGRSSITGAGGSGGDLTLQSLGNNGNITFTPNGTGIIKLIGKAGIGPGSNTDTCTSATACIADFTSTTGATSVYIGSDNNGHTSATTTRFTEALGASDSASTIQMIVSGSESVGQGLQTKPVATSTLLACSSGTAAFRAAVNDATAPAIGVALTGGGTVFATVHCSGTTNTYIVDGL